MLRLFTRAKSSPAPYRPEKIPVQLFRDFEGVGAAGEIVRVKPAFMRNTLHRNNGAGYILKGQAPKLPVVEKKRVEEVSKPVVVVETPVEEPAPSAMPLDQLSSLFGNLRKANVKKVQHKFATSDNSFSVAELRESFPAIYTVPKGTGVPELAEIVYKYTGIEVPVDAIKLVDMKGVGVAKVEGECRCVIGGRDRVEIKLLTN